MTIEISKEDYDLLLHLGATYYSHKGAKPVEPKDIVHRLIEEEWREAHPPEYQTSGFDRQ
jgi:hypothetical protein